MTHIGRPTAGDMASEKRPRSIVRRYWYLLAFAKVYFSALANAARFRAMSLKVSVVSLACVL
jgi:hypothetical protein